MQIIRSSCKSCGCIYTHTHGYNFIKINGVMLYPNRIGFINNVKECKNNRLNLREINGYLF